MMVEIAVVQFYICTIATVRFHFLSYRQGYVLRSLDNIAMEILWNIDQSTIFKISEESAF